MNKKPIFFVKAACLSVAFLSFAGCQDKDYYDPSGSKVDPEMMTFATDQLVELRMNYLLPEGYTSTYKLYTENPSKGTDENGRVMLKDGVDPIVEGINVTGTIQSKKLPLYAKELYAYSDNQFVPSLMKASVKDGVASFEVVPTANSRVATASEPQTRTYLGDIDLYLRQKDDFYLERKFDANGVLIESKWDVKNPDKTEVIPGALLTAIDKAFPPGKRVPDDSDFLKNISIEVQEEGAEIFVTIIAGGGAYSSSLCYFVYEGAKDLKDLTLDERKQLEMNCVFQYADALGNSFKAADPRGLVPGHYVQLKYKNASGQYVNEFPQGAKIGWMLYSDGFDETKFEVNTNKPMISSISAWNQGFGSEYFGWGKRTIYFSSEIDEKNYVCFGFEDTASGGDFDCNDVIFMVESNPVNAITPPPVIETPPAETIDVTHEGILTFEDNWPTKGDYDLNDVVMAYSSTVFYTKEANVATTVEKVSDKFTLVHNGATFNNGFSYKVNLPLSQVKSITIKGNAGQATPYTAKADGNGFIIDLIKNTQDINEGDIYIVDIVFADKTVTETDFETAKAPYNPFIRPSNAYLNMYGDSEKNEVHLPFHTPTQDMEMNFFGMYMDASEPANGIYYAAGKGIYYPFALHLAAAKAGSFKIPVETRPIDFTYPRYMDWVNGGCGTVAADWYLHPNP